RLAVAVAHDLVLAQVSGSRTRRKPTNGASGSHQRLFGSCGSVAFHAGVCFRRVEHCTALGGSSNDPPLMTESPSKPCTHSATLPSMSWLPSASGSLEPGACVRSPPLSACHARASSVLASVMPSRHACSHSASVGTRYLWPV